MNLDAVPVQTGPLYTCFACGAPALIGKSFAQIGGLFRGAGFGPAELDDWGEHIWYLRKACPCEPERVVRLGDCLAPLYPLEPKEGLAPADIPRIREALAAIARSVQPGDRQNDPATRIVFRLLAGQLTPDRAIAEIRAITTPRQPARAALPTS